MFLRHNLEFPWLDRKLDALAGNSSTCSARCLQTDDACICQFSQLTALSSIFPAVSHDLKLAMIGTSPSIHKDIEWFTCCCELISAPLEMPHKAGPEQLHRGRLSYEVPIFTEGAQAYLLALQTIVESDLTFMTDAELVILSMRLCTIMGMLLQGPVFSWLELPSCSL